MWHSVTKINSKLCQTVTINQSQSYAHFDTKYVNTKFIVLLLLKLVITKSLPKYW